VYSFEDIVDRQVHSFEDIVDRQVYSFEDIVDRPVYSFEAIHSELAHNLISRSNAIPIGFKCYSNWKVGTGLTNQNPSLSSPIPSQSHLIPFDMAFWH
jgi:hypothetical protein